MFYALSFSTCILALTVAVPAMARDTHHMFPVEDALSTANARDRLDADIKLYFGNQKHPPVSKRLGEWRTSKKTNAFGKDDKTACEWAFLSAAMELQERARKEGGNAVINITSNYRNVEKSSDTEYECGAGALMAGVAFKGTVVKLAQ